MASTSSNMDFDDDHRTLSVYNCLCCNKLLDGNSKILECLHVICNNCVDKETVDSSLQCKICRTVTKGIFMDYPIISPDIVKANCENNCETVSKQHLCHNAVHKPNSMMDYPIQKKNYLCTSCKIKSMEIHCKDCSVFICARCHLVFHGNHDFELLEVLCKEIREKMTSNYLEINKKNDNFIGLCIQGAQKNHTNLENQKNLMIQKIDKMETKLHEALNLRKLELINSTDNIYDKIIPFINNEEQIVNNAFQNNKYLIDLIEDILKRDTVFLSQAVLNKLNLVNNHQVFNIPLEIPKSQMQFNIDETLQNCVSNIKAVGNISSVLDFGPTNNDKTLNIENLQSFNLNESIIKKKLQNVSADSDTNSEKLEISNIVQLFECSCCNKFSEKLIECNFCNRNYHNECHIPVLAQNIDINEWKCTLCQDITIYSKTLNQEDLSGIIPIAVAEHKIMERILMEFYCKIDIEENLKHHSFHGAYLTNFDVQPKPLSLNIIKCCLESAESYSSLIHFLKEMDQLFSNGILYHHSEDPYYSSAINHKYYLRTLIAKWIPKYLTQLSP